MNPILSAGLLIGLLCSAWMFVMGFTGWYRDPATANFFFLVIPIQVAGLVWGLRKTAAVRRTYGSQLLAGTMMSIVAGVVIIAASLLFTTVVFPTYLTDVEQSYRASLQQRGLPEADIAAAMHANSATSTPMAQAQSGFIGTLVTGIIASAVIALFVRRRPSEPSSAAQR
jgi:hypothetical protein